MIKEKVLDIGPAAADYRGLLDKGYPEMALLKLVGDRYRLSKEERIILFRGILDAGRSARIAKNLCRDFTAGVSLAIDGYNVLLTMVNFRRGHPLFIGTDGLLRDAGGAHGRIGPERDFMEALKLLADRLQVLRPSTICLYLDSPVSGSGGHAAALRRAFESRELSSLVETVPAADPFVRDFDGDLVASADSMVAMLAQAPVFDLARDILQDRFGAAFLDMASLI